jgi:hypothetical protein
VDHRTHGLPGLVAYQRKPKLTGIMVVA